MDKSKRLDEFLIPLERRSLSAPVVESIRAAIHEGALEPGVRLVEQNLAQRFNVSRGPIRDAITELEKEGLVELGSGRGKFVARLDYQDLQEIYTLRLTLEKLSFVTACDWADASDIATLQSVIRRMESGVKEGLTGSSAVDLDLEFHESVFRASKHRRLFVAWQNLRGQVRLMLLDRVISVPDFSNIIVQYHQYLLDLVEAKNHEEVVVAIEEHLDSSFNPIVASRVAKP
ncbi:MAG: GntR family transcriptional regulator [Paracoccaceae bacterium]|nr:GntR family transcriptional regulator [Paracoccaceae bacterium]